MQDDPCPRFLSRGRAFVYILPCAGENMLKIGFSRDPMQRLHALHRRFFQFFDLDRGLLIETDRVRAARAIERALITAFANDRAPVPLLVAQEAGGETEWFRGVHAEAVDQARSLASKEGLVIHDPLSRWLCGQLQTDVLYDWSLRMLDAIEFEEHNVPAEQQSRRCDRALRDILDLCANLHVNLAGVVADRVLRWHAREPGLH